MSSLGSEILVELKRVRELLPLYEEIPMGFVSASIIQQHISNAESALASGDVIKIMIAYQALKTIE